MGSALIDGDPQRVGDYWLAGRLGAGGQGVVYEAYDLAGERVAIKILRGDPVEQPALRDRMAKEAVAAQRVASFCTARVLDAELEGPRPYIVSEYVEGPSLRAARRIFRGDDLHRLATAIATALTAIHDAGVVHRDLKPDNVLLGPDGPRVIDFGIARTLEMSVTSTGMVTGTPGYMAPEVFSGERAGPAADVFAWAAVVLYAATGADPFTGEALGAVMHRVLSHEPDLSVLPASLRGLVGAALSKEPAHRPAARELLLGLLSGDGSLNIRRLLARGADDGRRIATGADDPALGVIAEDAYAALEPADKELVPELFLRLITVTEEGELALREPRRSELPDGVERVLGAFTYVVSGTDPVRLMRPALPLAWPRLRAWIEADKDGLAVHRRISTAAGRWQEHGRHDGDLFHGSALDDALSWAAGGRKHITLTPAERDFLQAGASLSRRRSRRARLVSVGLAVLLVLALAAGALALRQSITLTEQGATLARQRDTAESARLAAAADGARAADPVLAMLLGAAAGRLAPTDEARSSLLSSAVDPASASFRDPDTGPLVARMLTADGRSLISVSSDEVRVWDVATRRRAGGFTGLGLTATRLRQAAVSEDGRMLAVADSQGITLWELATGRRVGKRMPASDELDLQIGFSGGRLVVTAGQGKQIYDWRTGKSTVVPALFNAAVHPDGSYAVSGTGIWTLPAGRQRPGFGTDCDDCASTPVFSPDGRRLAVGQDDGLTLYDTRTREEIVQLPGDEGALVPVFSRDGRLVAGFGAKSVTVWQPGADEPMLLRREVTDPVTAAAFDGNRLRYLSGDTVVTLRPAPGAGQPLDGMLLSHDGRFLATHALDATTVTLNGKSRETGTFEPYDSEFAFSRDGSRLALKRGERVSVRDTATWRELANVRPEFAPISEDASALPTAGGLWTAGEKTFTLWQVPGGKQVRQVPRPRLLGWTIAANGRLVGLDADLLRLVDLESGEPFGARLPLPEQADRVWFSPDLRLVAANFDAKVGIWHTGSGAQAGDWLRVNAAPWDAAFSPDGRLFAFASQDQSLSLWDVGRGERVGPEVRLPDSPRSVAFSPGSAELLAIGRGGRLTRLPTAVEPLLAAVCGRAGRGLTEAEWRRHLPERPYERVCPGGGR
ncbi:serine/threonine-protein kinase [Nonomuraea sp. NPDC050643]|uniref:WD40 repeat domain-containing serine/threonine protein kinase n=1 Tax=Nonomuraea sp. NPDC050643 TaxID=3155660 RepID=UPI0033E0D901